MANNQTEFNRAKNESEPLFSEALKCYAAILNNDRAFWETRNNVMPFSHISNISGSFGDYMDKIQHADILATGTYGSDDFPLYFDVKDVSDENMRTGNYVIGNECKNFLNSQSRNRPDRWFAFRENDGNTRLNRFIVVSAFDVIDYCESNDKKCPGCHLYRLIDIKNTCKTYQMEPDIPA